MLLFKSEDMWVDYHHVVQLSPHGAVTIVENGVQRKLRIPRGLYQSYRRMYRVTWFSPENPHRMAFMKYKGHIVEIQPAPLFGGRTDEEIENDFGDMVVDVAARRKDWISPMESNLAKLVGSGELENRLYDVFFDGSYIYRVRKNRCHFKEDAEDQSFAVSTAEAFRVAAMKEPTFFQTKRTNEYPITSTRGLLMYRVGNKNVVSPSLSLTGSFKGEKLNFNELEVVGLNKLNKMFAVNLDFLIEAANTIRRFYGHHAIAILDIPGVLAHLKLSSLKGVDRSVRRMTPIGIDMKTAIAWLMGFMHQETDFERLRRLFSLFNFLLSKGLIFSLQKEGKDGQVVREAAVKISSGEEPPKLDVDEFRSGWREWLHERNHIVVTLAGEEETQDQTAA